MVLSKNETKKFVKHQSINKFWNYNGLLDIRNCIVYLGIKIRAKTFFTIIFENPRFNFSKKSIFEDQKVIFVGSSDSSVLIGVWYIQQTHWVVFMTLGKVAFGRNKKGGGEFFSKKLGGENF